MPDLYIVTITLTTKTQHQLFFDMSAKARTCYDEISARMTHLNSAAAISVRDDYEANITLRAMDIVCVEERNWNRQQDSQIEAQMHQAKAQARGQRRAAADPELKFLAQAPPAGMLRA